MAYIVRQDMITLDKLAIYKRYSGDIDGLARVGTVQEKQIITDNDWFIIDEVLQYFAFKKKGLIGDDYNSKMQSKIDQNISDQEVADELERMA
jgi:hypothetical protein